MKVLVLTDRSVFADSTTACDCASAKQPTSVKVSIELADLPCASDPTRPR